MRRNFRPIPPSLRAIENASWRPTLCFVVRDDENKTGGMIVRDKNLPAEVGKTQTPPRSASEVIAEMAAKVARYPAKPKEEWEGMSAEEMFQQGWKNIIRKDFSLGEKLWIRAAEQECIEAQCALGRHYRYHSGFFPQDATKAAKWYRRAAKQGHAKAQCSLGLMYRFGEGVPQNYAEAVKWLRRAAEQGHVAAQETLAEISRQME